jgi:uncharacterized protein
MRRLFIIVITTALFLFVGKSALAYESPGGPLGFVNDFAGLLKPETKESLLVTLSQFKQATTSEIAVVTVNNLGGDSIENFAHELFREWEIGTKEKDNGVLLLVSKEDRKVRIEVGYGLEGALPDATAHAIIQNNIIPEFKNDNYDLGIKYGVESIILATKGEYTESEPKTVSGFGRIIEVLFFVVFFGFNILISILAPSKSWWLGGVIGGVFGIILGLVFWSYTGGVILGFILLVLGLLVDYFVSKSYQTRGFTRNENWTYGGGWTHGGRSNSTGGFGGFSGGSSGGGGASGSW